MYTTQEELSATLDRVALEILDAGGVDQPPVDALELARALKIAVGMDPRQEGRARYVRLAGYRGREPQGTILLRPEPRLERRHWAVAHEIGEHTAWRVFEELGIDPRETVPTARETIANHLAGRVLVPSRWFSADAALCQWNLVGLKSRYATASHELLARRMLDFPPPIITSIFDQGRLSFRRSNVCGRVPPPSPAETACWRVVHERNQPYVFEQGQLCIRGWPVHEEGWKREILRTEVNTEADE